jgi:hypothetical protein
MNRLTHYLALLGTFLLASQAYATVVTQEESYKKDVSPILHDYCLNCHKPKGMGYEKNGLDMRTYKSLMKGTKFGPVIKPGDSFTSVLIMAIQGRVHPSIKMPYGVEGGLSKDKIEVLKKWVDQGAKDN